MFMVLILNTVGLIGLALFIVMGGGGGGGGGEGQMMMTAEEMAEGSMAADSPGMAKPTGAPGPMVDVGTLVVNLKEAGGDKYLKAKINLELDSDETLAEVLSARSWSAPTASLARKLPSRCSKRRRSSMSTTWSASPGKYTS